MQFPKSILLASTAFATVSIAGPAFAQDTTGNAEATKNTGLSEIVVTARKRVESAQDIPVVVTAISAQTLEQRDITSIEKIAAATPSLTVGHASNGSAAQVTLRGIGSSSTSIGIEQSVATVVDGVYYGQGRILEEGFFDLAGVEVLKGPQVLFFGKNATAGVISIKTADPTPDWEFKARASYEFKAQEAELEGVASGPLADDLGIRVALRGSKAWGGYYKNVSRDYDLALLPFTSTPTSSDQPGNRQFLGRVTLKYEPTSEITNTLKVSYNYNKANNSSYNYVAYNCPTGFTALSGDACGLNFQTHQNDMPAEEATNFPYAGDGKLYNKYRSAAITNTFNYELGTVTLTNVTNYNWNNNRWLCACEFQANPFSVWATENSSWKAFSNEARALTHFDGPLNVMVGLLYQKTKRDFEQFVSFSLSDIPEAGRFQYIDAYKTSYTKGETISGFGQVTWKLTDNLELDGGVRYTHETKKSAFSQPYVSPSFAAAWVQGRTTVGDQTFTNWSPEVSLTYKPIQDVMFYASYKTGYKSGGFSNGGIDSAFGDPAVDLLFDPETAKGFEAGVKSTLLNNQLRLNLGAYSYKYKNLQIDFFNSSIIAFQTLTADARTKGVELDFEFAPYAVPGLNVHGSLNYNDAKYDSFPDAPCYAGQTPDEGCNLTADGAGGYRVLTAAEITGGTPGVRQNLNGMVLGMAPHWTGSVGFNYDAPVGGGFKAGLGANMRYSSSYLVQGFGVPHSRNSSYATLDAGLRFGAEDDSWQLAVIGKNLTNKQYINGGVDGPNTGSGTGTPGGVHADQLGFGAEPRTVTVQVTTRF